jgi:Flp pilus assembly protein TadD
VVGQGQQLLEMGALVQAEALFRKAVRMSPEHGEALMGLADVCRALAKDAEAAQHYQRYLQVHPAGPRAAAARAALEKLQ